MDADADLAGLSPRSDADRTSGALAEAAERVRLALVRLRGGSPLLSPADEILLLGWLDAGVPLARILRGLDVAAEQRLARRIRAPLTLAHARKHVAAAPAGRRPARVRALPLAAPASEGTAGLAEMLRGAEAPPCARTALDRLADHVAALPPSDPESLAARLADLALAAQAEAWEALDADGRAPWLAAAEEALAEVLADLDDDTRPDVLEAYARGALRDAVPAWSVTRLVDEVLP